MRRKRSSSKAWAVLRGEVALWGCCAAPVLTGLWAGAPADLLPSVDSSASALGVKCPQVSPQRNVPGSSLCEQTLPLRFAFPIRSCSSVTEEAAGQKCDFSVPRQLHDAIACNGRNGVQGINVLCSLSFLFLVITWRDLLIAQGGCRPAPTSSPASSPRTARGTLALARKEPRLRQNQRAVKKGRMWALTGKNSRNEPDCTAQIRHIYSRSQCALEGTKCQIFVPAEVAQSDLKAA